jgi:flagellar biosynthesis chaperone FliJ
LGRELKIVEKLEEKQRASFEDEERLKEKRSVDGWVAEHWAQRQTGLRLIGEGEE